MTESVFYNLASHEGVDAIERLRELGHAVGLHAVHPNAELDERFDPVVSWHNPKAEYMSATIPGAINVYAEPYFDRANVPLGLEPELALRLPPRGAPRRGLPLAPDPRPPGDLGLRGRDDGTYDARDAERGEGAPTRAARRRRHRPRVTRPLRVVHCPVNTAGVPWANVQALRRRGVDAQLVVFNRYTLHSEADWSLERRGGFVRKQVTQWSALARLLPKADVFHFYFGLDARPAVGAVPDSPRAPQEIGDALPRLRHPREVAHRARVREEGRRRGGRLVRRRSAGCRRPR